MLVAAPLVLLTLTNLGIILNGFAVNVAESVAVDTARFAALADQDLESAKSRGLAVLDAQLTALFRPQVELAKLEETGNCEVEVTVTMETVPFGLLSSISEESQKASAICETQ